MAQLDLFDPPADGVLKRVPEREMAKRVAEFKATRGMESAAAHSDDDAPGWTADAVSWVRTYALLHERLMAEDVRAYAEAHGLPKAAEPRAWGKVMRRAAREKIVESFGFAPANSSNRSPKVLWRSLIRAA